MFQIASHARLRISVPDTSDRFRVYGPRDLEEIASRFGLDRERVEEMATIAKVLPFRVNEYVLTNHIDWADVPNDPMFQMLFPQPGMLDPADIERVRAARTVGIDWVAGNGSESRGKEAVTVTRLSLKPHPSGQRELNLPSDDVGPIEGVQHKYERTILYFPANGQTCHSYCTYCFRWAQFTGEEGLRFAARNPTQAVAYLRGKPEVTDVLVTGGDPMVMSEQRLRVHIEPFLEVPTVETIRVGTKSLSFWPQRYLTDPDADATLAFFREIIESGRSVALMTHFSHPRELDNALVRRAIDRLLSIGVTMYAQAPLIRRVNDDPGLWETMWRTETSLGITPFYMFVARETGPHEYYKVPLDRAWHIFSEAYRRLPGLARTVRGPVMSATAGKVVVDGVIDTHDQRLLQLRFLQARDAIIVNRPFHMAFSDGAAWVSDLKPLTDTAHDLTNAIALEP